MDDPKTVYGVDFSGAKDAGKKIWIAEIDDTDGPNLNDCFPVAERFDTSTDRANTHHQLTAYLGNLNDSAVVGLDFPFALPKELVSDSDWETFLLDFPEMFHGPDDFRRRCKSRAARLGRDTDELKRDTEKDHEGLSAYHYYLYKQTFYGIRDVLRPLVLSDSVQVPPLQSAENSRTTVIETYPAGVLDQIDSEDTHREGYKKSNEESRQKRKKNLELLRDEMDLKIDDELCSQIVNDSEGDGLDAVLAAYAAWKYTAHAKSFDDDDECYDRREGYIYV